MKKYLKLLVGLCSFSLLLMACSNEDEFVPPNFVTFETDEMSFTVNEGSSGSFDVTLYTANLSGEDRTFTINVDESSTLDPAAYELPSTVVVPANTNEATFTVNISDNEISNTGETLVLKIEKEENLDLGSPLTVNVSKFCPVDIEDYVGSFTGTGSWSELYGYTTEVETFYNNEGELMINGLTFQWFQDWWGEEIVNNQPVRIEIDEETGTINIPEQFYIESTYGGAPQLPYNIKGTGRINACEKTMIIYPVLVQDGTDITGTNWDGGVTFVETITLAEDSDSGEDSGEETEDGA